MRRVGFALPVVLGIVAAVAAGACSAGEGSVFDGEGGAGGSGTGIGGGGLLVYQAAGAAAPVSFDGRETAPASASQSLFLDADGKPLAWDGQAETVDLAPDSFAGEARR